MIKYHDKAGGTTQRSLKKIHHVDRLGKLFYVKGHTYKSKKCGYDFSVVVRGENGICTFTGFSFGYSGEGPRGLLALLNKLGIDNTVAKQIVFGGTWNETNNTGVNWVYHF